MKRADCELHIQSRILLPITHKKICGIIQETVRSAGTVGIAFVGEEAARALNKKFRQASYVPDILSFPAGKDDAPGALGELVVSPARVREQARQAGVSFADELAHVLVHGTLHLIGEEHGTMHAQENNILARLGYARAHP